MSFGGSVGDSGEMTRVSFSWMRKKILKDILLLVVLASPAPPLKRRSDLQVYIFFFCQKGHMSHVVLNPDPSVM